jgi:nucleoside-diphosphate-sugar epimerase
MKILLTGSTGFVGKHLLKKLPDAYCFSKGDDPAIAKDFDVVFHVAGEIKNDSKMFESNVVLTHELLKSSSGDFIYVGSSSEYGRKLGPISENENLVPTNLYEATKGCGSLLCLAYAATGRRVMIARPFSLYGPGDHSHRFFPTILRAYQEDTEMNLFLGSHDWIFIDDFIDGLLMLLKRGTPGDIVNFGTGVSTTNHKVVRTFEWVLGKPIKYKLNYSYSRDYDSTSWVCDTQNAKDKYNFRCKYDLEQGIRKFVSENY